MLEQIHTTTLQRKILQAMAESDAHLIYQPVTDRLAYPMVRIGEVLVDARTKARLVDAGLIILLYYDCGAAHYGVTERGRAAADLPSR